ncbi:MAG: class I SAM-dependent methyltransferase [Pseudomonadota bacterium]|nr:class I SAM-dependent methyltransferase [Pseudomonadota bacterium]
MIHDRASALAEPRGTIALAYCRTCGFAFNSAFEAALVSYDTAYESTQTHSRTFTDYMRGLVADLNARATGSGTVLDVGCGQGEFLAAFAEVSDRPLIGVDPALDFSRCQVADATLIPSVFRATDVTDDLALITCKMTLEHVVDPVSLIQEIAACAARSSETLVFLQVPNTAHIYERTLFADIIYEHVNYFTAPAIHTACARAGLEVIETFVTYGDQHLGILARAGADTKTAPTQPDTLLFEGFQTRLATTIAEARETLTALIAAGRRPIIWGAGSKAVAFLNFTGLEDAIDCAIDINPLKRGTFLPGSGIPVFLPEDADFTTVTDVVVMNPVYANEIAATLQSYGCSSNLHLVD